MEGRRWLQATNGYKKARNRKIVEVDIKNTCGYGSS